MSNSDSLLDKITNIATILGAIAIPVVIYLVQSNQTGVVEQQNRRVGIAQILLENYSEDCEKRLNSLKLIEDWFDRDIVDNTKMYEYLNLKDLKNGQCPSSVADDIQQKKDSIKQELIDALSSYKIGIHYLDKDKDLQEEAKDLKEVLVDQGLDESQIARKGLTQSWFNKTGGLSSNQIRYERSSERLQANALRAILNTVYPNRSFNLQTIRGNSPNSISIFLLSKQQKKAEAININYIKVI